MSQHSTVPSEPGAFVDEKTALIGGVLVSIVVTLLAGYGVIQIMDLIGNLVWLGIALYVLGLFVQFWTAQSYLDGLTVKEVAMAVIWPVDTYRTIRAGVDRQNFAAAFGGQHIPADQDNSKTLVDEKTALWGGIAATAVVGLPLIGYGMYTVLDIISNLIWLAVTLYCVGFVVTFWATKAYTKGLTVTEVVTAGIWPYAIYKTIRAGVKKQGAATA